jgi:VWFA-related protein
VVVRRLAGRAMAFLVLAILVMATLGAQEQPTFRTSGEGVRVDVLVTDGERPVAGLAAKDFELIDSGVKQEITVASLAETPLDVLLVLDTSTSVGTEGLAHLVRAADALFERLKPKDRAGLVAFSQDVLMRAALTPQHLRVRGMLRTLKVHGMTAIIDATYAATQLADPDRPTLMLVFSDGLDTASWLRRPDVLDTARRSGVVPYAVVTGEGIAAYIPRAGRRFVEQRVERLDDDAAGFLGELVRNGGGVVLNAEQTRDLEKRFGEALDSFRQRYVLTYSPTGVERTGWHPITIRIKGHGGYRVRARSGYFVR